ncbi:uncharacterized protein LACBIDRAFT_333140 [Laccaria bicolor S238N-H82]|uniref:Predicted protein n=1 Tax=Laccaria bicolor (strain S238N-H82 / ATCC MYA-4686) TaxID=486041 RepID=B0DV10_LACBS|nr:uncharacterized protein LACBIDRAFT_333140 [Laccaria bicolor S238N-H82]EDR01709.1 predicted protein [Laccaria bicolor S238N-H82]|eukprot:XP_001887785.1 predicted protein [Laccaria bicolor S238N-H82]
MASNIHRHRHNFAGVRTLRPNIIGGLRGMGSSSRSKRRCCCAEFAVGVMRMTIYVSRFGALCYARGYFEGGGKGKRQNVLSKYIRAGGEAAHSSTPLSSTCTSPHPWTAELDDHTYSPGPALAGSIKG